MQYFNKKINSLRSEMQQNVKNINFRGKWLYRKYSGI